MVLRGGFAVDPRQPIQPADGKYLGLQKGEKRSSLPGEGVFDACCVFWRRPGWDCAMRVHVSWPHLSIHLSATSDAADATSALLLPAPSYHHITRQLDGIDGSAFTALDVLNELLLSAEQQSPVEQAQVRVLGVSCTGTGSHNHPLPLLRGACSIGLVAPWHCRPPYLASPTPPRPPHPNPCAVDQ